MGMLTKGSGKDLPSIARRVERLEMFLAGFQREKIVANLVGRGISMLDVLAIPTGKSKSGDPFEVTSGGAGKLAVSAGSYQIGNTSTDVDETAAAAGTYAYARIKQDISGTLIAFEILISPSTKPQTEINDSGESSFVEFSNVLLAEVVTVGGSSRVVQRRAGNLLISTWVIDGYPALWAESTGGTINQ